MCEIKDVAAVPRICILVLSGLPGSGKSSLARYLKTGHVRSSGEKETVTDICNPTHKVKSVSSESQGQSEDGTSFDNEVAYDRKKDNLYVLLVSYDDLIPEDREVKMIQSSVELEWKESREKIITCVESLVRGLLSNIQLKNMDKPIDDDALWERFCDVIQTQEDSFTETKGDKSRSYVVVIDDNMYYRSMRYKYFQLARKYEQGFCQVHLQCTKEIAKERNNKRNVRRVPDEVIATMATKMEVPDSSVSPWEKHFITLKCSTNYQSQLGNLDRLVQSAMSDPPRSVLEDTEGREESQQICSVNQLHQADQILRKLVGSRIKRTGAAMSQQARGQFAKLCSVLKSQILKELRGGNILVPTDIPIMDASKMEDSLFSLS
ncbi:L-seryl-tRNA(Sec) kinase-like isoform X3 [Mizuhopecten yessoensis]|uniref:L-seryl-tRNA(Sec) kinase-like isoform X2 n=1 Tax=Mizuhopecten yessoensis TaxID=6573 RepID=UPI000B45DA46|nr:L-seryl-tRNA(Sec) kinase-like isoform X2 [Mizuhopecten yessoensis]XP_021378689.1 L-seryl-tRNA(Sec) kinase-like isoform X3 [Mizuhopecten yessoensis]